MNIPKGRSKNPDAIAVVFGISRYKSRDVYPVDYAKHDAAIMKQYLSNAFGLSDGRIHEYYDDDATLAAFQKEFREELPNLVRPGRSDVFVFYSGHGIPDLASKGAVLAPFDCEPDYTQSTCYSLSELQRHLESLNAHSVTLVIDACFTGSSERGPLLKGASPVVISVEGWLALGNGTFFAASSGNGLASWFEEKRHGLFTYYFLKGLGGDADLNRDRKVTVEEMENYLAKEVPDQARSLKNRKQTPQVITTDKQKVLLEY